MGLDQLGVLSMGNLVANDNGHSLSLITLLAIPPWYRKTLFLLTLVITLGRIPYNTWSTRHSLTLVTTGIGG